MTPLLLYAPQTGPRLRYILEEVFRHRMLLDYRFCSDPNEYLSWEGPKVNYSAKAFAIKEIHIPSSAFLFEQGTSAPMPETVRIEGAPALFPMQEASSDGWSFDFFAMAFFLLSRYEEYVRPEKDAHGRFPFAASLAAREGFSEFPLLDYWTAQLAAQLRRFFPVISLSLPSFSFLPTFDIDQMWAFRHKPFWVQFGGGIKDLVYGAPSRVMQRLRVSSGLEKDPFDSFSYILGAHSQAGFLPVFFFLLADRGPNDVNHSHRHPALQKFIRDLPPEIPLGIHPSYRSGEDPALVQVEKRRLEGICGHPIRRSRQHFLRLRMPYTYRALLEAGIEEDYSMGYADAIGFRAGTSVPFRWYDLEKECSTGLLVTPFQVMDVTLRKYLGLTPKDAAERLLGMLRTVRRHGGQFCSIWHNSSFDERGYWHGWTAVYDSLLKESQNPTEF